MAASGERKVRATSHRSDSEAYPTLEKHLQALEKLRREKIAEFKKATNFDKTRNLLERFDDAAPGGSPVRPPPQGATTPQQTPQRGRSSLPAPLQTPGRPSGPQTFAGTPRSVTDCHSCQRPFSDADYASTNASSTEAVVR